MLDSTVSDPKDIQLPIEIWMVIIDIVLDEDRRPYIHCNPESFSQFQVHLAWCNRLNNHGRMEALNGWRNIRAVSRLWRHLARGLPYLALNDASDHIPKGTSSIILEDKLEVSLFLQRVLDDPSPTLNITTISFQGHSSSNKVSLLFDSANLFPGLKYLAVRGRICGKMFWGRVEGAFPNLISLSVRNTTADSVHKDPVVLKRLEILSLEGDLPPVLVLPSLKHVYIPKCPDLSHSLWKDHGHQIESLLVTGAARRWRAELWEIFPNVIIFGDRSYCDIPSPPDHHPFRHLRIFAKFADKCERATRIISNFPGITHVHITSGCMGDADKAKLVEFCEERGLNLVSVNPLKWKSSLLNKHMN